METSYIAWINHALQLPRKVRAAWLRERNLPLDWAGQCDTIYVSQDRSDWAAAYKDVRSCMQGKGAECHAVYVGMHNCTLFVAERAGKVVARCVISANGLRRGQMYGESAGHFDALLDALQIGAAAGPVVPPSKFGVIATVRKTQHVAKAERHEVAKYIVYFCGDTQKKAVRVEREIQWAEVIVREHSVTPITAEFLPYLDNRERA